MGHGKRVAYGALFCIALPVALTWWAQATARWIHLPVPPAEYEGGGWLIAALGLALMAAGMRDLFVRGGGLPMNAFPPPHLVATGVYGWIPQPIYVGATAISAGVSIGMASASGLWLVTPTVALGAAALVWGYERHDLLARFHTLPQPAMGLPPLGDEKPSLERRLGALTAVLLPWLLLYQAVVSVGAPPDAVSAYFPFERHWPVWPLSEAIYITAYAAVPAAFFAPRTLTALRRFTAAGLWATAIIGLLWWTVPLVAPPRPMDSALEGFWVDLMRLERDLDGTSGTGAFPSFHACWALLVARACADAAATRTGAFSWLWAVLAWLWAVTVAVSCITTGMHAIADVAAGALAFALVDRRDQVWEWIRQVSERIANSWREWRLGPVRIINHGLFGALGALTGALMVCALLGDAGVADMWILGLCAIVTAGLWAQIIEGESVSLRPFGYYGAVVGFALGGGILALMGRDLMAPWAAFAVGGPWIQAWGRCRCLIQGCCHGHPCGRALGIHYRHPRSRVVRLAGLGGQPLHPTQTYSILWNVVCGLVLLRLVSVGVPAPALVGVYLLLAGLGRFVEESFRGEPQTPRLHGLAVYQWNAMASAAAGMGLMAWPGAPLLTGGSLTAFGALSALGLGLVVFALMGVDFPGSTRRFARLTK